MFNETRVPCTWICHLISSFPWISLYRTWGSMSSKFLMVCEFVTIYMSLALFFNYYWFTNAFLSLPFFSLFILFLEY